MTFDEFLIGVMDDTKSVEQLMEDAWDAATARAAKIAEDYTYQDPDGSAEQIQDDHMHEIARRIREGGGT